ncbi:methylated-DNA--[protein]-cysteine S-methyltransferase [Rhodobacterales bacterium HKCCE2091]|nr:methylated-DNA--[protein]-cysteine S-methyltransferase [Rhodobacterales bacterium HKCCE2091]
MRGGIQTPIGPFWAEVEDGAVVSSGWGFAPEAGDDPVLRAALDELKDYFDGRIEDFTVPLRYRTDGVQGKVMAAMAAIPFGHTRTYGEIAAEIGAPAQSVGQACGANRLPVFVPCHRVLAAEGLGGFSAPGGIETKVALLKHEGAASLLI